MIRHSTDGSPAGWRLGPSGFVTVLLLGSFVVETANAQTAADLPCEPVSWSPPERLGELHDQVPRYQYVVSNSRGLRIVGNNIVSFADTLPIQGWSPIAAWPPGLVASDLPTSGGYVHPIVAEDDGGELLIWSEPPAALISEIPPDWSHMGRQSERLVIGRLSGDGSLTQADSVEGPMLIWMKEARGTVRSADGDTHIAFVRSSYPPTLEYLRIGRPTGLMRSTIPLDLQADATAGPSPFVHTFNANVAVRGDTVVAVSTVAVTEAGTARAKILVWRSVDGGASWVQRSTLYPHDRNMVSSHFAVSVPIGSRIDIFWGQAGGDNVFSDRIMRATSIDAGASWSQPDEFYLQPPEAITIASLTAVSTAPGCTHVLVGVLFAGDESRTTETRYRYSTLSSEHVVGDLPKDVQRISDVSLVTAEGAIELYWWRQSKEGSDQVFTLYRTRGRNTQHNR